MRNVTQRKFAARLDRKKPAILPTLALCVPAAAACIAVSAPAVHAEYISVNFQGRYNSSIGPTNTVGTASAGVVPTTGWNDIPGSTSAGVQSGSGIALTDSTGASSYATLSYYAGSDYSTGTPTNANENLLDGFIYSNNGSLATFTVSGLNSDYTGGSYEVIVYFESNHTGAGPITISNGAASFTNVSTPNVVMANGFPTGDFEQATSNSYGNYVIFTGMTNSTFTVSMSPANPSGNPGFSGFQVVPTPEPASLALLGLSALGLLARPQTRRRRSIDAGQAGETARRE